MEQINAGILKLMNNPGTFVVGKKTDFGANREPSFDVLLEQKNNQARSEVVTDKGRKPETSERETDKKEATEKKNPSAEETEEENCDVAREVAAAQIVWVANPNAADLRVPEQQENVATVEQPLIIGINDEPGAVYDEEAIARLAGNISLPEEQPVDELVPEAETEVMVMPEQMIETVPENELTQMETNVAKQNTEEPTVEVTGTESEETGGEAAVAEAPLFKDVETAPIKVAEAPERTEKAPEVEKQVSEKLTHVLETGETKVEIQLEPVELGKLTIELTRTEDGTLSILFNAENSQTRGLLERHMDGLQEALAERGQQGVQITVNHSEESQRQNNNTQYNDFQDGSNGQQSEQQRRDDHRSGDDFLQQLRLGLIPIEEEEEDE